MFIYQFYKLQSQGTTVISKKFSIFILLNRKYNKIYNKNVFYCMDLYLMYKKSIHISVNFTWPTFHYATIKCFLNQKFSSGSSNKMSLSYDSF